MATKTMIENEILFHGWGHKGQSVALVPSDTRKCLRTNSGRSHDPSDPSICGYGSQPKQRLLIHPTIRIPEGRPIECPECGGLAVLAHSDEEHTANATAVAEGRVIKLDATRGIYTTGDLMEFLTKLSPGIHVELVSPDQATVPYEEPVEAAAPKSEVDVLKDRLAAQDERMAKLEALLSSEKKKPADKPKATPDPA